MTKKHTTRTLTVLVMMAAAGSALAAKHSFPQLGALGPVPVPDDNKITPAKVALGKLLYFDPRLGGDMSTSCADCHSPSMGWQDNQPLCRGYPGTEHWRNCQTIVNSAYYTQLFWAGSVTSLEKQAPSAARGAVAGNGERDMMEERLAQVPLYLEMFEEAFGTPRPLLRDAWRAIATFERTLVQRDTPFDLYMLGDKKALSKAQKRGKKLFEGKAGCIQCHNGAFFTDEKYYNLGVPTAPEFKESVLHQITFRFEQYAKGVTEDIYRKTKTDLGLYYRKKGKEDMGKFRTPTLRYLTFTAPYMHNGTFFELSEVIDFYNEGGGEDRIQKNFGHSTKTKLLKPLGLTDGEKEDLVTFLESLTGEEILMDAPELPKDAVLN
ncbi:MAG: cytochrome-c peroxidase [Rhodospirillaceae bacterium]|nr:cytochrome-c peroxidase [Rhodospirillaceae bacterium]